MVNRRKKHGNQYMKQEGELRLSEVLSRGSPASGKKNFRENCLPAYVITIQEEKKKQNPEKKKNPKGKKNH